MCNSLQSQNLIQSILSNPAFCLTSFDFFWLNFCVSWYTIMLQEQKHNCDFFLQITQILMMVMVLSNSEKYMNCTLLRKIILTVRVTKVNNSPYRFSVCMRDAPSLNPGLLNVWILVSRLLSCLYLTLQNSALNTP